MTLNARRMPWTEGDTIPAIWITDGYAYRAKHKLPRINLALEAEKFVNHALAHGCKYAAWRRAWLNWIISPFCKGEPEAMPEPANVDLEASRGRARLAAKGIRVSGLSKQDIELGIAEGLIDREKARMMVRL